MKRLSIFATLVVTGLLGIAAVGAGSASADVLCKKVVGNYNCPTEDTYGVGTEFQAENWPGGSDGDLKLLATGNGNITMATCTATELDALLTDAGGYYESGYPKVDITNLIIGFCGDDSISVISDGEAKITTLAIGSPSLQGTFRPSGLQIKVTTNWLGQYYETGVCTYNIVGTARIEGAKTNEWGANRLVFNDTLAELVSKSGQGCTSIARLSGQLTFSEPLTGIYVLPE